LAKKITIDASVALKWFLDEDYTENARNLLKAFRDGDVSLNAPSILQYEIGNALWTLAVKRNLVEQAFVEEAYHHLLALPIEIIPLDPIDLQEAFSRACEFSITLYDASYLVVAKKTESQFVSADGELIKKTGKLVDSVHIQELRSRP